MKGYYCIYDSCLDRWWYEGETWSPHRLSNTEIIPDQWEVNSKQGYSGTIELEVIQTSTKAIEYYDHYSYPNKYDIMKFPNLREAEKYLLTYDWIGLLPESFLSIRKIYFE